MKVGELISQLQKFPLDTDVEIYTGKMLQRSADTPSVLQCGRHRFPYRCSGR